MRKYSSMSKNHLSKVVCNGCGKTIKVHKGMIVEGSFSVEYNWGYFSDKDGERHIIDLCEECYDEITSKFKIGVEVEDNSELM